MNLNLFTLIVLRTNIHILNRIILILFLLTAGCQKKDTIAPIIPTTDPPFDDFWLSTSFGVPATNPAYYFNTFAMVNSKQMKNGYYGYLSQGVDVPSFCSRSWVKTSTAVTASVKCTLQRQGTLEPNTLEWPSTLVYEFKATADLSAMKVNSAKLNITGYGEFDFLKVMEIMKSSSNGFDQLLLIGTLKVTAKDNTVMTFSVAMSERLN